MHKTNITNQRGPIDMATRKTGSQSPPAYRFSPVQAVPNAALLDCSRAYDAFTRTMAANLSRELSTPVKASACTIEQVLFGSYLAGVEKDAAIIELKLRPYPDPAVLILSPSLKVRTVELFLGDMNARAASGSRRLTELERNVLISALRTVPGDLREAWRAFDTVGFELVSIGEAPHDSEVRAQDEVAVVLNAEIQIRETSGPMSLILPSTVVWAMLRKRNSNADASEPPGEQMLRLVRGAKVLAEVCVQGTAIRTGDVLSLEPGQVILLPRPMDAPLDILLNGKLMFRGYIVTDGQRLSMHIETRCR